MEKIISSKGGVKSFVCSMVARTNSDTFKSCICRDKVEGKLGKASLVMSNEALWKSCVMVASGKRGPIKN